MGAGDPLNFWGLILVVLPGVLGGDWRVKYPVNSVCAVRGSAVVIPCEYDYPSGYRVKNVMWYLPSFHYYDTSYVFNSDSSYIKAEYKDRAEYLGNKEKNCTLKIKKVTDTDAGVYRFRFTTDRQEGSWTEQPGVTLQLVELKVVTSSEVNGALREGDSVTLTCDTGNCSLSQSEFIWFKDNQPLPETQSTLQFSPACHRDSGIYSCVLKGSEDTRSTQINLNIETGPWTVHYPQTNLCAVRGSTVIIQCEYDYPESYKVESRMRSHNNGDCTGKPYIYHSDNINIDAGYRVRAEFFGGKGKSCSLQIKNTRQTDAGVYRFRLKTNRCEQCGQPGVTLRVAELKVVMTPSGVNHALREGNSVTLTCDTGICSLSQSEFTWFKDKERHTETRSTLQFNPACNRHSGKYSCALKDSDDTRSTEVNLAFQTRPWTVRYPQTSQCAVRGSTVIIQSEHDYPQSYEVQSIKWTRSNEACTGKPYIYQSDNIDIVAGCNSQGKRRSCSLQIKNTRQTDAGVYRLRFTGNRCEQCGQPGVSLRVAELKVAMTSSGVNRALREGDSVTLTCDTGSCSLSQSEFTWFKDNQPLPETQSTLQFVPACYRHSGKYSCALKGSEGSLSAQVDLVFQTGSWTVGYPKDVLCAVRGSTVIIQCEYDYPESYKVESRMWSHNNRHCTGKPYVCHSDNINTDPGYRNRAEFFGDKGKNCSLQIRNITETDAGVYRFRFTTNGCEQCGQPGVTLQVDELKVVMTSSGVNGTLREGDSVNLTCDTGICSRSQSEFIWFKDNEHLPETQSRVQFDPVFYRHSGKYWCALKGYREKVSDFILLNVHSKSNQAFISSIVGISLAVLAVTLVIIICRKRKKRDSVSGENNRGGETPAADDNEYANIAETHISSTRNQEQKVSTQQEEVCYASVQINTKKPKKLSAVHERQSQGDAVIYSSLVRNRAFQS